MTTASASANRQIARAAGTVMAAFVLSQVTGLVRQVLVSYAFGTSGEIDAFNAAATFPDLIFSLVAGGALASAFLPTLSGFLAKEDRNNAWYLSSAIGNLVFLLLAALSLLSIWLAPQIVGRILAPSYSPQQQALTVTLLRILLLSPAIFGISGLAMSILNAHQVFLWPALAPSMYWLGMIFGVVFLRHSLGIFGLAWGAVLGAAMHLLVQAPALLRLPGRRYYPVLGLHFSAVREVGRLMGPRLLGVSVVQLNFVINTLIATGLAAGSLTAIKYAWAVMTMPQVVIAQGIAIAALPTFSAQAARGDLGEMRTSLAATLRGVILLALPATVGLILLSRPVIGLLFERGVFDARSTSLVGWALVWYTAGLLGHSIVEIASRAFYALHDTWTPVIVGVGAMSLNAVFSFVFVTLFSRLGWLPHGGLALANSSATALEAAVLLYFMRRRLNGLEGRHIWQGTVQAGLAAFVMGLALWGWLHVTAGLPSWLVGLGGVGLGGALYLLAALVFGMSEVRGVARFALRRAGLRVG